MAEIFFLLVFLIPFYAIGIWTYFYPEESMLFGRRWMYQDEPEFSEAAITYTKFGTLTGLYIITAVLLMAIINHFIINHFIFLGLLVLIMFQVFKLRKKLLND